MDITKQLFSLLKERKSKKNQSEIINLIEKVDVDSIDEHGNSILMVAILYKNEVIPEIIKKTKNINQTNYFGNNALLLALINKNDTKTINLLISNGADMNQKNKLGVAPINIIAKYKVDNVLTNDIKEKIMKLKNKSNNSNNSGVI